MNKTFTGKITFFISYPELGAIIEEIFHQDRQAGWEAEIITAVGVKNITGLRHLDTDVVVARGVTAAALKHQFTDIPVVDLPVSGYDILRAVCECQRRFGSKKIGIVGSHLMTYGAKSIESILDIELIVVEVRDEGDAEPSIQALKDSGVTTVIGGVMSTLIAEKLGMNALFIQTGREAVYQALHEARRVVQVRRQEQERAEQLRVILDYSAEGIVAVDAGGAINLVNEAAVTLTGLSHQDVGRAARRLLPELGLDRVLASGRPETGEIETISGHQMAVNRVPIVVGGRIAGAVATFQRVHAIQELEGKIRRKIYQRGHIAKHTFAAIVGDSPALQRTLAVARQFSAVDSNLLITGETGTGKEIFAQSIHNASKRAKGPFVAVNCAALTENLLESELFGYAEGAFTGAVRGGKMGLFEQAHLGTIFLDEISEMSPKLQGRLLRVLQEREIMRLGDDRVIPVNIRVIAATNRDLARMMGEGHFREDLYYRVDILRLTLPPLRDRREDIIPLIRHFLSQFAQRSGRTFTDLDPAACRLLLDYSWPGNIRELRNIAERLVVLGGGVIGPAAVAAVLTPPPARAAVQPPSLPARGALDRAVLLQALENAGFHYGRAAAALGISRTTLWRRLKQAEPNP